MKQKFNIKIALFTFWHDVSEIQQVSKKKRIKKQSAKEYMFV